MLLPFEWLRHISPESGDCVSRYTRQKTAVSLQISTGITARFANFKRRAAEGKRISWKSFKCGSSAEKDIIGITQATNEWLAVISSLGFRGQGVSRGPEGRNSRGGANGLNCSLQVITSGLSRAVDIPCQQGRRFLSEFLYWRVRFGASIFDRLVGIRCWRL